MQGVLEKGMKYQINRGKTEKGYQKATVFGQKQALLVIKN